MLNILQSETYQRWFNGLRSQDVKATIAARIYRLQFGHAGDAKSVGKNLYELRLHVAGGIRIYYTKRNNRWILLLAGGDKSSQTRDIAKAKTIAESWELPL